ncbi:MAG TPA: hypothetical protein VGB42_12000 [Candidatus Thermoplasmatota archaeon]
MATMGQARMEELPLAGVSNFLVRQRALAIGATYDVMDENKNSLFKIKQDASQAVGTALVGAVAGKMAKRYMKRSYEILSADDRSVGKIAKGSGAFKAGYTIQLNDGRLIGVINTKRSLIGGLKATLVDPQNKPMIMTKGNLIRRKYMMKDNGGNEVARVTAKLLQIRDTYKVELKTQMHPIYPLTFAIIIDFQKDS